MADDDKIDVKIKAVSSQMRERWTKFRTAGLDLSESIRSWVSYKLIVRNYFKYWSYKNKIRTLLRYTALAVVSLSTLTLAGEISLELAGHEKLLRLLRRATEPRVVGAVEWLRGLWPRASVHLPESKTLVIAGVLVFLAAAVIYLTWHNAEEAWKPGYEYQFASAINSFLLDCRSAHGKKQPVPVLKALEVCHFIFEHAGIRHVSMHLPDSGSLSIRPEHVYPRDPQQFSETRLQLGEGLAGRVFEDNELHIQYLPRMFFPVNRRYGGWLFPHTEKLRFKPVPVPNTTLNLWRVGSEEINANIFKRLEKKPILYRSLLSVPMFSVTDSKLVGVLNLAFSTTDPLDKAGIAMALVFALLLGGEISNKGISL